MTDVRIKPWRRTPSWATCDECGKRATMRVHGGSLDIIVPGVTVFTDKPSALAGLGCEDHYEEMADLICDAEGSSCSTPLRYDWWRWFMFETRIGSPIGAWQVRRHNRQFERSYP